MNRISASAAINSDRTLNRSPDRANRTGKSGSSLVEVMVACVILAIIAVAGAEYLYHGQATLVVQTNRRIALEVANSRLEDIRGARYASLTNGLGNNLNSQSVRKNGTNWILGSGEKVSIGGALRSIQTTFQFVELDGVSPPYDALNVTVSVGYKSDTDLVTLRTLVAPKKGP